MALYDAFVSYSHAKDKPTAAALTRRPVVFTGMGRLLTASAGRSSNGNSSSVVGRSRWGVGDNLATTALKAYAENANTPSIAGFERR